jgi:hypothetical protein
VAYFDITTAIQKNIPIVRVGNLAALNEEKISTDSFREMEGYLIECRSTGGLSGSPVFLNLGSTRSIGGKYAQGVAAIFLLGLIHGHFVSEPHLGEEGPRPGAINAGIAIVVPVKNILAVIKAFEKKGNGLKNEIDLNDAH